MCRLCGLVPDKHELQNIDIHNIPSLTEAARAPPFDPFVISRDFSTLLALTRSMTKVLRENTNDPDNLTSTDHVGYSDIMYLITRSLVHLCLDPQIELAPINQACTLALVTFADSHLRDMSFYSRMVRQNVMRLKLHLETAMEEEDMKTLIADRVATQKLLWTLVLGGVAAIVREEREWFVSRLASLSDILGLREWGDVERVVQKTLWEPAWEPEPGRLWKEVQMVMERDSGTVA
jgi:hypothetical protein